MKNRRVAFIWLLVSITAIFLFADFLHTETTLNPQDDCPICLWERQVIAISKLYFLFLLAFFIPLFKFANPQEKVHSLVSRFHIKSRAPPTF